MGRSMFMSLEPTARAAAAPAFMPGSEALSAPRSFPWYLRPKALLSIWAALSVMWGLGVAYNVCERVSTQADMSRDVENDLDQGFVSASCTGPQCSGLSGNAQQAQNWSRIASTYIKFGSDEMAESIFGPPVVLLVIGLGTVFALRRRARYATAAINSH